MEGKDYELELPEGYESALTIDATDKKFALRMNLAALIPLIPAFALVWRMIRDTRVEHIQLKMLLFSARCCSTSCCTSWCTGSPTAC